MNGSNRISDINRLYKLLGDLAYKRPPQLLSACLKSNVSSLGGVYFFYECGEYRSASATPRLRVVRVGKSTTLCNRLLQHKGNKSGGGNHRASIFRLLVGTALLAKNQRQCIGWDINGPPSRGMPIARPEVERWVTGTLGQMWVLWLPIKNKAKRNFIESNAIALLSNYSKITVDCPSWGWLGYHCTRPKVRKSGLWNQDYVGRPYDQKFLTELGKLIP